MQFYSGFSLQNEEHYFEKYINHSDYTICGFSYGAIQALYQTKKQLAEGKRVDRLQLFSPAFFQTKSTKFKRLQLLSYAKNEVSYLEQFISACFFPYVKKDVEFTQSTATQLEKLLYHEWKTSDFVELEEKGVVVEVYLGEKDSIIDIESARDFFVDVASVTFIKGANHFLEIK